MIAADPSILLAVDLTLQRSILYTGMEANMILFKKLQNSQMDLQCLVSFLDVEGNERAHTMLEKLARVIQRVQYKGDTYDMKDTFNPYDMLPNNISDYWTYQGSLTTPPCYESVTWIVFCEPIRISRQEIGKLRSLKSIAHFEVDTTNKYHDQMSLLRNCGKNPQCIGNNFRPVFPLGDRIVQSSFI